MGKKINNILKGEIASSVFYILFGLCLVVFTEQTVNVICKVVFGLVMAGAGIYHIFIYAEEKENSTILDLFTGVIVLVLGGFLFFTPQIIVRILPYLLGAFVLVDSIWTLRGAWKLKKLGNEWWKVLLIGSLVFVGLGVCIIVNPFTKIINTAVFAGAVMLANGLSDFVFLILLRRGIKRGVIVAEEVSNIAGNQAETQEAANGQEETKEAEEPGECEADNAETVEYIEKTADADDFECTAEQETVSKDVSAEPTEEAVPEEEILEEWKD